MLLMQHQYLFLSVVQNTLTIDRGLTDVFIKNGLQSDAFRQSFFTFSEENATSLGGIRSNNSGVFCTSGALMTDLRLALTSFIGMR
jgi:hypothetical protein